MCGAVIPEVNDFMALPMMYQEEYQLAPSQVEKMAANWAKATWLPALSFVTRDNQAKGV